MYNKKDHLCNKKKKSVISTKYYTIKTGQWLLYI